MKFLAYSRHASISRFDALVIEILAPHVEAGDERGAKHAAELVGIDFTGARSVVGNPEGEAVGVALVADRLHDVIASQQRHGAAQRFQVVPPSAAGAGIDEHVGMMLDQLVPIGEVAGDVLDFGDALAVLGIGARQAPSGSILKSWR